MYENKIHSAGLTELLSPSFDEFEKRFIVGCHFDIVHRTVQSVDDKE